METTTVTRKQLYEEVWTEPMARLAKRYGLSDVGLAKICAAHNIPRPPRGYWAKKRSGQTARRTRLPNPDQDDSIVIHQQPGPEATPHIDEAYAVAKKILDSPDRIQVADTLVGAHKLVRGAHQGLKHAETDEHGLIVPPKDIGLCIRVTKTHLRRALQAMDALLKALEQREYSVSPGPQVEIMGQRLSFEIVEVLETVQEQPDEPDLTSPYRFGYNLFTKRKVPSGRLLVRLIDDAYGARYEWGDKGEHKLEDCLDNAMAGLIRGAGRQRQRAEKRQAEQEKQRQEAQAREEESRRRAALRRQYEEEKARVESLFDAARKWVQAEQLRQYVAAAAARRTATDGDIDPCSDFGQWLKWAREQADRLDPLVTSPPSILDQVVLAEPERSRWSW